VRSGYLWLAAFLFFPVIGAPLLTHRAFRSFGIASRAVLSAAVGTVLLSLTMTVWALLGWKWNPLIALVPALLAAGLRTVVRGEEQSGHSIPLTPTLRPLASRNATFGRGRDILSARGVSPPSRSPAKERVLRAFAIGIAAISVAAAFAATSAARSTSPDLVLFWGPKAQQFAAARTIDAAFLGAPHMEYLHTYYPPLVTNLFASAAMVAGRFPWGAATLTFPLVLAALAIGLPGILSTGVSSSAAAATSALAVSAIALLGIEANVAGNAEIFLLFFEVLAVALLLSPQARGRSGKLLAALLLSGAAASKVEAIPFVLATVVLFALLDREAARPLGRTILLLLFPTALALGAWFLFGATKNLFWGYRGYGRISQVSVESLPVVLSAVGAALWKAGSALPWAAPLLVFLLTPEKTRRALLPLGVAAALGAFFLFTYLLHGETDVRLWIEWSAARIFSPLTALLALACLGAREAR